MSPNAHRPERLAIRSLRSARKLVLAVSRQPENAVASYSPTSALPPSHFRYSPPGISRLSAISDSSRASVLLPPLHSRDQQTSIQHEIASVRASPRNPDRHLPALVLLAATPPAMPVLWTCDRARVPLPTSSGAPSK